MKNPADVAKKWATNLSGATASIQAGVQATTVNPAQLAAAAVNQYLQGVQNAVSSGRYAAGLGKVTLASWQNAMIQKGLPRIAQGATQAQPKMQAFMSKWLPYMDQQAQMLQQYPRGDFNANIQRMIQAATFAHNFVNQ